MGQLVWVPFGRRYLQGLIIGFDEQSPVEQTREVDQIVDEQPVLSPLLIDLAHWMSNYYLAPIQRVVHTMLPPGVLSSVDVVVRAEDEAGWTRYAQPGTAPGHSWQNGPLTLRQLASSAQAPTGAYVDPLVKHGGPANAEIRSPHRQAPVVRLVKPVLCDREAIPASAQTATGPALLLQAWQRRPLVAARCCGPSQA